MKCKLSYSVSSNLYVLKHCIYRYITPYLFNRQGSAKKGILLQVVQQYSKVHFACNGFENDN